MKKFFITALTASLVFGTASAMKPVTISEQGSFMAGVYNGVNDPKDFSGNTLHGYGQSGKSWATAFKINLALHFCREARRPTLVRHLQNRRVSELLRQCKNLCGNFPTEQKVIVDAMIAAFEKSGEGILITHSAGGGPGWMTAIKSNKVKGVIAFEPGTFPFPKGELPAVEETTSPFPAVGQEVSREEFMQLTKIPIVVYFGDNIPSGDKPVATWGFDNWRT